jgi:signal transduction histidine kinase
MGGAAQTKVRGVVDLMTVASRPKPRPARPPGTIAREAPDRPPAGAGRWFEDLQADFLRKTDAGRCAITPLRDWRRLVARWLGAAHTDPDVPDRGRGVVPDCRITFARSGAGTTVRADLLLGGAPIARITVTAHKTGGLPRILRALTAVVPQVASRLCFRWLRDEASLHERERLIHDLHDGPLQVATAAKIRLQSARQAATDPAAAAALDDAIALTGQVVAAMRALLRGGERPVEPPSLEGHIRRAAARWADLTGMQVRLLFADGAERAAGFAEDTLDILDIAERVVGESIVNAWKHGKATQLSVRCREKDGGILLTLTDDGAGMRGAQEGERHEGAKVGLRLLRSRVRRAGGRLTIRPAGSRGTIVEAWLPIEEPHPVPPSARPRPEREPAPH